jgi:hypothetical protein
MWIKELENLTMLNDGKAMTKSVWTETFSTHEIEDCASFFFEQALAMSPEKKKKVILVSELFHHVNMSNIEIFKHIRFAII